VPSLLAREGRPTAQSESTSSATRSCVSCAFENCAVLIEQDQRGGGLSVAQGAVGARDEGGLAFDHRGS
jgi:hypothetical protein